MSLIRTETFYICMPDETMSPTLRSRDAVLVDRGRRKIRDGHLYALRADNGVQVRRLVRLSDWLIRVVPDNPLYPPTEVAEKDVEILGEIVSLSRGLI